MNSCVQNVCYPVYCPICYNTEPAGQPAAGQHVVF